MRPCIVALCGCHYASLLGLWAVAPRSAPAWMPGVYAKGLCKDAKPTKHTHPFTGKGVWGFGKDAEIERPKALQEAKPSECPKGDRDNKSEVDFKNRLFLQSG